MKWFENGIIVVLALMAFVSVGFAAPSQNFVGPTPSNATWRNGTQGLSLVTINVTLNETIHLNASSFIEWYNATNASTNVSLVANQFANWSTGGNNNYSYWRFNLSNDGVHRFVVRLYSVNSSRTNTTERYIYYDNSTPQFSVSSPSNDQAFTASDALGTTNISLNFVFNDTGSPGMLDRCFYVLDNSSNQVNVNRTTNLAICDNLSFIVSAGASPGQTYTFNFTVNDSAGNMNSTYFTFRAVGLSGGGGGGGAGQGLVTDATIPAIQKLPDITQDQAQSGEGIFSVIGGGNPISNAFVSVGNAIRGFIASILAIFNFGK